MKKIGFGLILCGPLFLGGCGLWPYQADFDCVIPKGVHCKSLYEVNQMAERGEFSPDRQLESKEKCSCAGGLEC